jgi:hypothetical protein
MGGTRFASRFPASRAQLNERAATERLLRIAELQSEYHAAHGNYATGEQLLAFRRAEASALGVAGRPLVQGYRYRMEVPRPDFFFIVAVPASYGETGTLSLYLDSTGVLRGADKGGRPADAKDPPQE